MFKSWNEYYRWKERLDGETRKLNDKFWDSKKMRKPRKCYICGERAVEKVRFRTRYHFVCEKHYWEIIKGGLNVSRSRKNSSKTQRNRKRN